MLLAEAEDAHRQLLRIFPTAEATAEPTAEVSHDDLQVTTTLVVLQLPTSPASMACRNGTGSWRKPSRRVLVSMVNKSVFLRSFFGLSSARFVELTSLGFPVTNM
jgi:hypothetical protein